MLRLIYIGMLLIPLCLSAQKARLVLPDFHSENSNVLIEISRNQRYLATASWNNKQVKIWDYTLAKELKSIEVKYTIMGMAISPDNQYLALACGKKAYIISLNSLEILHEFGSAGKYPKAIQFSPDSRKLYFGTYHSTYDELKVYRSDLNGENPELVYISAYKAEILTGVGGIHLSEDGRYMLVNTEQRDDLVNLRNVHDIKEVKGAFGFLPNNLFLQTDLKNGGSLRAVDPQSLESKWEISVPPSINRHYYPNSTMHGQLFIDYRADQMSLYMPISDAFIYGDYNRGKLKLVEDFHPLPKTENILKLGSNLLVLSEEPAPSLKKLDAENLMVKSQYGVHLLNSQSMSFVFSNQAPVFALKSWGLNIVRQVRFDQGKIQSWSIPGDIWGPDVSLSRNGEILLLPYDKDRIDLYKNEQLIQSIPFPHDIFDYLVRICLSDDGKYLAMLTTDELKVFEIGQSMPVFTSDVRGDFDKLIEPTMQFGPANKLLIHINPYIPAGKSYNITSETLQCYDIPGKKLLWTQTYKKFQNLFAFHFSNAGEIQCFSDQYFFRIDAFTGIPIKNREKPYYGSNFGKNAFTPDGRTFCRASLNEVKILGPSAINKVADKGTIKISGTTIKSIHTYKNQFLFIITATGNILLWDIVQMRELGRFFFHAYTEDWAFVSPEGYFDGSSGAISQMYFVKGKQFLPLEQYYEKFYRPNLLAQALEGSEGPETEDIDQLNPPPTVRLEFKSGSRNLVVDEDVIEDHITTKQEKGIIVLSAKAPDDQVREIRLYHNGKRMQQTRGLVVDDDIAPNQDHSYPVNLLPGINRFKAIAINSQGTESIPTRLSIQYEPASIPDKPTAGMTLHLLVIGINEYKNPKYNLNYALADAQAFESAIQKGAQGITSRIQPHFIRDDQAHKREILSAFETIQSQAQPQDIFMFYYAGHGVMAQSNPTEKEDFFLIPYDITQLYGAGPQLQSKGISATELKSLSAGIKAQKQLFILDACQSAGAVESIAMRGVAEERAIAQLARSTGTHWITASGSEQYATEFAQIGHGVFTYALLQGLAGKADSGDQKITVNELKAWVESAVPTLTKKYKGQPQYPASYGFGQDFPIVIMP